MKLKTETLRNAFYIALIAAAAVYVVDAAGKYVNSISLIDTLSPLFTGLMLAYLLNPLVRRMEKLKVHRVAAILIVYVLVLSLSALLLSQFLPILVRNLNDLASALPGYAKSWGAFLDNLNLGWSLDELFDMALTQGISMISSISTTVAANLMSLITNSVSFVFNLLVGVVISFYFMLDRERIWKSLGTLCPARWRERIKSYVYIADGVLSQYLRGLLVLVIFMAVVTTILMQLLGVRYALVIGIVTGVMEVVPVFGAWIAAVPAAAFALLDSPYKALMVTVAYVVLQQLEGNILVPRVMGKRVGVHPIAIIVGMLAMNSILGFTGILLSVPIMGIIKLLYINIRQHMAEKKGESGKPVQK